MEKATEKKVKESTIAKYNIYRLTRWRNWIGKAKGGKRNIYTRRRLSYEIFSKKQSDKLACEPFFSLV